MGVLQGLFRGYWELILQLPMATEGLGGLRAQGQGFWVRLKVLRSGLGLRVKVYS